MEITCDARKISTCYMKMKHPTVLIDHPPLTGLNSMLNMIFVLITEKLTKRTIFSLAAEWDIIDFAPIFSAWTDLSLTTGQKIFFLPKQIYQSRTLPEI